MKIAWKPLRSLMFGRFTYVRATCVKHGSSTRWGAFFVKKTYLLIKALEKADGAVKEELSAWLIKKDFNKEEKVNAVTSIYETLNLRAETEELMNHYFSLGFNYLKKVKGSEEAKTQLEEFSHYLIHRDK